MTDPTPDQKRTDFIDSMSRAATGVCLVTTDGEAGRFGLTVSAMASVSADPPALLICVNRKNPLRDAIVANGDFAVNVLQADQRHVAEIFSGRPQRGQPYDFGVARWQTSQTGTGSPLLVGAVARFDCRVTDTFESGTHTIFVGEVVDSDAAPGNPLVYQRRRFAEVRPFPHRPGDTKEQPLPIWDEPEESTRRETE